MHNLTSPDYDIDVVEAWDISKGAGVTVAVVDRGIDPYHNDLSPNFHSRSFDAESGTPGSIFTGEPHGTHVAGIIAAVGNNGTQVIGVAHQAKILRISHDTRIPNATTSSKLASGINWAWNDGKADVINCSWGDVSGAYYNQLHSAVLEEAIINAMTQGRERNGSNKGCVVVFSSGNTGRTGARMDYPANFHPDILAVGAIDRSGLRMDRSSNLSSGYGERLDVVAPGVDIISTLPYNNTGLMSGTSMAAPHVAGIAALILSKYPDLTQREVVRRIEASARKVSGYSYTTALGRPNGTWHEQMGYGLVNAHAALVDMIQVPFTSSTRRVDYADMYTIWRDFVFTSPAIAYPRTIHITYEEEWGGYGQHGTDVYIYTSRYTWPANTNRLSFSHMEYEDRNNFEQVLYRRIKHIDISSSDPNYYYVAQGFIPLNIPLVLYRRNITLSASSIVDSAFARKGY